MNTRYHLIGRLLARWLAKPSGAFLAIAIIGLIFAKPLDAQITPNGSVSPSVIIACGADPTTFTRDGSTTAGFAWSEATLWAPDSSATVLGNQYTNPYSENVDPTALTSKLGIFYIQYRLVDVNYDYADQWIEINENLAIDPPYLSANSLTLYAFSADSSLSSLNCSGSIENLHAGATSGNSDSLYNTWYTSPNNFWANLVITVSIGDDTGTHYLYIAFDAGQSPSWWYTSYP